MGKVSTSDALTTEGRRFMGQMAALKSKPRVKVGILSRDFDKEKETPEESWAAGTGAATLGEVAVFNEFGTTYKTSMRTKQLRGGGIAITMTSHGTPERSFIRSTVDESWKEWKQYADELRIRIIHGMDVDMALGLMGARIQRDIQRKIRSNIPPPNEKSTIDAKGGKTHTLINTGQLLNSIAWELLRGNLGDQDDPGYVHK